ncbi:MAG: hypothetical protein LBU86_00095 [Oscillospiraceae bacterium]|jgi:flagellar assembly protein FliH|nr:hypothetical protein [Oscillospiraceae bacterium]
MTGITPGTASPQRSPRIVKYAAVVEDSAGTGPQKAPPPEPARAGIIKKQFMERGALTAPGPAMPARDAYLDELNRLKVEIKQKEDELKALGRDIDSAGKARAADAFSVEAAEATASDIMARAEFKASQIISDAGQEGVLLREQAKNDGYLEGFSKGYEEAVREFREKNEPVAVELSDMLDGISDYYRNMLAGQGKDMTRLSIAVAEKILGQAFEADQTLAAAMLRGIIEEHSREEYIKVTLSPDLAPIRAKAGDKVRALIESMAKNVTLSVDRDAPPGTAVIEMPGGLVDASIQTQLDNLTQIIQSEQGV